MINLDVAWIGLIGTVFGGAGLKIVEYFLSKDKVKDDEATQIRSELREEVNALRASIVRLDGEVDVWKQKYYDLQDEFIKFKKDLITQNEPPRRRKTVDNK